MSYDKETALKPLTGDPFDAVILNEREQRHEILIGETNNHVMPALGDCDKCEGSEKCRLRRMAAQAGKYADMINQHR